MAKEYSLPERLAMSSQITYCSPMDVPPLTFYDENSTPSGLTVEIANRIAKDMGNKKVVWKIIPFSGMIPALLASQCDMIVAQLFDKPERRQVIDIVNYMESSQAIVVAMNNPKKIATLDDLSGKKVAVNNGSTIKTLLDKQSDAFVKAGKPPINIVIFPSDGEAFQALRLGQVDAHGTTMEAAGYYETISKGTFKTAVPAFNKILTGFGIRKEDQQLSAAVHDILTSMQQDGSYQSAFRKWNIEGDRLPQGKL
ncbi:ABC transporter substrate-binding protein (plasmid) [Pantoea cypripedii]|uniref:ABC transporter substrate-binding protein n=1 Tax=Pantoea cypripedii TaxID=55209 RepID=A0A6B9GCX0_PANCY|nr:ABC transporter substrate-binding protein [Pantoea cypripedii]QGY33310.1 ABC transporter substrate-binding protein [Pantoea cypripedii]